MGFSLRPLGRRITDIFDANSAQDQAKRVAVGQPRMYADQQKAPVARGIPYAPVAAPQRSFISKAFDQINPLDNNRTFQQAMPTTQRSNINQIGRALNTGAFGVARSSVGIANDLSGFADLITPGKGTNRFTNATRGLNENIDRGVKIRNMSTGLYKGAQGAHQVASFLVPGAVTSRVGSIPKVARGLEVVSDVASKVPGAARVVEAAANGGKVAKVVKWAASPTQLVNVASDAAQGAGFRTARGQDNSLATAATDIGTSVALAGTLHLGGKGLTAAANKGTDALRSAGVMRPSVLNDAEVAALQRFKEQSGGMMDPGVYEAGLAAAQKAGVDLAPTSSQADDLIKAHQTYNVRKAQPRGEDGALFPKNDVPLKKNELPPAETFHSLQGGRNGNSTKVFADTGIDPYSGEPFIGNIGSVRKSAGGGWHATGIEGTFKTRNEAANALVQSKPRLDYGALREERIAVNAGPVKVEAPQVGKTEAPKPKVGLKKNEKDSLARIAYKEATDRAAIVDAQNTVNKIREKAFKEGNRNLTKNEMIKEALAMEKITGVKNPGGGQTPPTPKAKVIQLPKSDPITEVPKTPGAVKRAWQSMNGVISQYGTAGKEFTRRAKAARNNLEIGTEEFIKSIPTVQSLNKDETTLFAMALKRLSNGETPDMPPRIAQAVQEWADAIPSIRERALKAGIEMGDQGKYYFPQNHKVTRRNQGTFLQAMVDNGKATDIADARAKLQFMKNDTYNPFGSLDKSREIDMPGYEMNKEAIGNYIHGAFDRITKAEQFGAKGEGIPELLAHMTTEGYDSSPGSTVETYMQKALGLHRYNDTAKAASSSVRQFVAATSLGSSAVSNASQLTNTATVGGILRTLKNAGKVMVSKDSRAAADAMGVTLDHTINDLQAQGVGVRNKILTNVAAPFFRQVERYNRRVTALVGADLGDHLMSKGDWGMNKLKELGVTGDIGEKLTPNQVRELGRGLVEKTQFKVDPMDLPGWMDSPLGKVVSQFKPFAYKQTEFMYHQVLKEAAGGNFAPMLRFLSVGVPIGLAQQGIKGVIKNDNPFDNNDGTEKSKPQLAEQGFSAVGGEGMLDSAKFLFQQRGSERLPQYAAGTLGGPAAGTAVETAINASKGFGGDWDPLKRETVSKVPVVGKRIANTTMPYEDKGVKPVKPGETATPAQLDDQATKQLKQMKLNVKAGDNALIQLPNGKYAATINGEVKQFDKLDAARNAARLDHALADGSTSKVLGDKHYYKNEAGETKAEPLYKYEYDKVNAQTSLDMYVAKDNEDYAGWTAAANTKMKALIKKRDGYNADGQEDEVDKTQKEIEMLKHDMKKYASYGGAFTKGKSGSKVNSGSYRVSLNAGGSAPRVTARTQVAALGKVRIAGGGTKPRVSSAKSRV